MKSSSLPVALVLLATAGAAHAQPPAVDVSLSPAVEARRHELGRSELEGERLYLQQAVSSALARGALARGQAQIRSVKLVIEDIQPTRPTSSQLGLSASLNAASQGLGGAAVAGEVLTTEGQEHAVRFRDFQPNRFTQTDLSVWGDADDAFDALAVKIAAGRAPDDLAPWPAPHRPSAPTGTRLGP